MGAVAAAVVSALERTRGLGTARKLYRKLLKLPAPGAEFFHAVLDMELLAGQTQAETRSTTGTDAAQPLSVRQLRDIFEVGGGFVLRMCGGYAYSLGFCILGVAN